jgi:hypothetical protein
MIAISDLAARAHEVLKTVRLQRVHGRVRKILRTELYCRTKLASPVMAERTVGAKRAIVVDLSQVTFLPRAVSAVGVRARAVTNKGGKIVLSSPNSGFSSLQSAEIAQFICRV